MNRTLVLCTLFAGALGLAACGGDDEDPGNSSGGTGSSSGETSSSSGGSSGASSSSGGSSSGGSSSGGSSSGGSSSGASACSAEDLEAATAKLEEAGEKAVLYAEDSCGNEVYLSDLAQLVHEAIETCADVRETYAESTEPEMDILREALAVSVTGGLLAGKTFAEALVGASIYSISPGVGPAPYTVTFLSATEATLTTCEFGEDDFECGDAPVDYALSGDGDGGTLTLTLPNDSSMIFDIEANEVFDFPAFIFTPRQDDPMPAYSMPEQCSA